MPRQIAGESKETLGKGKARMLFERSVPNISIKHFY